MSDNNQRNFPLTGIRIVDLTTVIAGPVATRVLAQLGAEVIKVEVPWGRAIGNIAMHTDVPGELRPYNKVASFNEVNRGKRSIAIDLVGTHVNKYSFGTVETCCLKKIVCPVGIHLEIYAWYLGRLVV